jgi:CubicO group peptidase (beta-lactamase class C family)
LKVRKSNAKGYLDWNTTLKEAYPDISMRSEYENIILIQLLSHRAGLPEWIYHVTSKNAAESAQFIDNWWTDRDTPVKMRDEYLKETVEQNLADKPGASVLVATNVRATHRHLFKAMNRIKEHYSSIADLPVIK